VAYLNVEHYKRLLETEIDEDKRTLLKRLLAEEEAKIASVQSKGKSGGGARSNGRQD